MAITEITSTENGECALLRGRIACVAAKPTPSLTVDFTASIAVSIEVDPADARMELLLLDISRGLFRLVFTSRTDADPIKTFSWHPPQGMTITAIRSSQGGKCALAAGEIDCRGNGKGTSSVSVDFLADGLRPTFNGKYWTYYGVGGISVNCGGMMTCPYHIPPAAP
jgi:hypothetical protein